MNVRCIQRILVATDFSGYAGRAVNRAAMLAHRHRCGVHLLQVVAWIPLEALKCLLAEYSQEAGQKLLNSVSGRLKTVADLLASHYGITVEHQVAFGRPHLEINVCARDCHADLIVLGAHGEHFLGDKLLGTTTARVLRTGDHPVLIASAEDTAPYQAVLVPVDFSAASRVALAWALTIEPQAAIWVLHAIEVPFETGLKDAGVPEDLIQRFRAELLRQASKRMDTFLRESLVAPPTRVTKILEFGYPPSVIISQARMRHIDLIVVGKHGEAESNVALLGSVTKHVINEADCDVLVVPDDGCGSQASNAG